MIHYDVLAETPGHREAMKLLGSLNLSERINILSPLADNAKDLGVGVKLTLAVSIFEEEGRNVYRVGKEMRRAFTEIRLNKITREECRLPHEGFYIDLDDPEDSLVIWGGTRTKWHILSGIYVYRLPAGVLTHKGKDAGEGWGLVLWGKANEESEDSQDDAVFQFILPVQEAFNKGLETYVKDLVADTSLDVSPEGFQPPEGKGLRERNKTVVKALRIAINTALYVTGSNPELGVGKETAKRNKLQLSVNRAKSPGKIARLRRQLNRASECNVSVLAPAIEEAGYARNEGTAKHTVRAHWHRYWVGETHEKYASGVLSNGEGKRLVRLFVEEYTRGEDVTERIK